MTLIKSISGIRGTIGGRAGEALTPFDIVKYAAAFGSLAVRKTGINKIVIGRDARVSGEMLRNLVVGTLQGLGIDVIDLGLSTTPTVEFAVPKEGAAAGIILTASHNPGQWNALKLLNEKGEFINDKDGREVLEWAESGDILFADVEDLGSVTTDSTYIDQHISHICALPLVDIEAIRAANFSVVVDAVNSTGGLAVPKLLSALGVHTVHKLYCEPNGLFPHNPEPLAENLKDLSAKVTETGAHLGIAVDPDVDRLCFVMENGEMFGEEYTLVAVSEYVLSKNPGATVSNLSSTRALRDVTELAGGNYFAAAVGEVNVVNKMKEINAVIGGEGNGGVVYPESHYGRDALVGIALFLSHLAQKGTTISQLRETYPVYYMSKNKIELTPELDVDALLVHIAALYAEVPQSTIDGVKLDFAEEWVHLRKSNTEPIVRIYSEGRTPEKAQAIAEQIIADITNYMNLEV